MGYLHAPNGTTARRKSTDCEHTLQIPYKDICVHRSGPKTIAGIVHEIALAQRLCVISCSHLRFCAAQRPETCACHPTTVTRLSAPTVRRHVCSSGDMCAKEGDGRGASTFFLVRSCADAMPNSLLEWNCTVPQSSAKPAW